MLDSDKTRSEINGFQPSESPDKRHYICYEGRNYTKELKQRQKTLIQPSLFTMRSFIFVKNIQATLSCSAVTLVCLLAISDHLSEVHLNNFVSPLTRQVIK